MRVSSKTRKSLLRRRRGNSPLPHVGNAPRPGRARIAKWRRWLVAVAVVLLLAWSAPLMVAHTPLRNQVLAWATGDLNGTVTAESASLGWFSPVVLGGVELRDAQGELVLAAGEVSLDRTLLDLLGDNDDLGHVRVRGAAGTLRMRKGASNVEDLFILGGGEQPQTSAPSVSELEIADGDLTLIDEASGASQQMTAIQARLTPSDTGGWRLAGEAQFSGAVRGGRLEVNLDTAGDAATTHTKLNAKGQQVPLAALQPLFARWGVSTELGGWLSGEVTASWKSSGLAFAEFSLDSDLRGEQLLVASRHLAEPVIRTQALHWPARLEWRDGTLNIEHCTLECDAGRLELSGHAPLDIDDRDLAEQPTAMLAEGAYRASGRFDLPRLAAMLPETIRVRQDTQITDGVVEIRFDRQETAEGASWRGRLYATSVEAISGGRRIAWERPVELDVAVLATPRGPVIDRLLCQSEFLHLDGLTEIEADGSQTALVAADYDLGRLGEHLGRFFDVGPFQLSGRGWTHVQWTQSRGGQFRAEARTQLQDYELETPGQRLWREPNLTASASVTGSAEGARPYALAAARIDVQAGDDGLLLQLAEGVPFPPQVWPLRLELSGDIAAWQARCEPFAGRLDGELQAAEPAARIGGTGNVTARVDWSSGGVLVHQGRAAIDRFTLRNAEWNIVEDRADADLAGWWNNESRTVRLQGLQFDGSGLSFETRDATLFLPLGGPLAARGDVAFSADLAKLQDWSRASRKAGPGFRGQAAGRCTFAGEAGSEQITLDAMCSNLAVSTARGGAVWREPELRLVARAERLDAGQTLLIDDIDFRSPSLRGHARGRIDDLAGAAALRLQGEIDYDANNLLALLLPHAGENIVLNSTRRARPFRLAATLNNDSLVAEPAAIVPGLGDRRVDASRSPGLSTLAASSELDWNGAVAYGFRLGPGRAQAELFEDVVRFQPIDVSLNDGKLTAQPWIDLRGEAATFNLGQGELLSQVKITAEMANGALKYVAPLLDGSTPAQGRFSIDVAGCSLPLAAPGQGEIAGRMTVHAIDIGPGPTLQAVLNIVNTLRAASGQPARKWETARLKRESVVRFRMVDGSVYHDGLELDFDGVTVKTRGRVGLDGTLNLAATFSSPRLPRGRSGQPGEFTLPIGGTLGQPELDVKNLPATLGGSLRDGTLPRLPGLEKLWEKLNGSKKGKSPAEGER